MLLLRYYLFNAKKKLLQSTLWIFVLFSAPILVGQPVNPSESVVEHLNTPYAKPTNAAPDTLQRLNLVLPIEQKGWPLLIWIGGGASYVDRHKEMDLARHFAKAGIAVACIGQSAEQSNLAGSGIKCRTPAPGTHA